MSSESIAPKNTSPSSDFLKNLWARPRIRELTKFCVVGVSSTAIDFGLYALLSPILGILLANTISFFCATCNGFYWNRRWTFGATQGDAKTQYSKFIVSNSIGWVLNVTIMTLVLVQAERLGYLTTNLNASEIIYSIVSKPKVSPFSLPVQMAAKAVATLCVMTWNFTAARLWTFKK
jgi:putative flippase GtrA